MKVIFVLAVTCLLTAACAPVVDGTGTTTRGAAGTSASGAKPTRLLRTPAKTPIGDPVTADLCAIIPKSTLRKWGRPSVHTFQSAGRCYYNVAVGSALFQLDTNVKSNEEFTVDGATPSAGPNGSTIYRARLKRDNCERAVSIDGYTIDTITEVFYGKVPARTLCGAAEALVLLHARLFTRPVTVPRRAMPRTTLTRFDVCTLLESPRVRRAPGLQAVKDTYLIDRGGGCFAESGKYTIYIQIVLIHRRHPLTTDRLQIGSRSLLKASDKDGCTVLAPEEQIAGRPIREYLDVTVVGVPPQQACQSAKYAAVYLLDAAGVR